MISIRQKWPAPFWSEGFDGHTFLSRAEWETYLRRGPVRRTRSERAREMPPARNCVYCRRPGTKNNRLQLAHRINALNGVRYLALTPEYLDQTSLLAWAHAKVCNLKVELDYAETLAYLRDHGVDELPDFLPQRVLEDWRHLARENPR